MIASTAGAASLGRLAVLSAIGEPLRAEIELSVSPEELDSVSPRLAAIDDYAAAGLTYNPALHGARLAIQYRHNGRRVIDLVTTRPVNETALAVVVELVVRGGRIARVYQVLLGPQPEATVRAAPPAAAVPVPHVAAVAAPVAPKTPPVIAAPVAKTRAVAAVARPVAEFAAKPVPAADNAAFDRELQHLDTQIKADGKVLNDMLARVAVMEREVAQLQKAFAAQNVAPVAEKIAAEQPAAEKPAAEPVPLRSVAPVSTVAATAPVVADPAKPAVAVTPPPGVPVMQEVQGQTTTRIDTVPRTLRKSNDMLNEALLVLAGGALVLFVGLGYVMLGRRRAAKVAAPEPDAQSAG